MPKPHHGPHRKLSLFQEAEDLRSLMIGQSLANIDLRLPELLLSQRTTADSDLS